MDFGTDDFFSLFSELNAKIYSVTPISGGLTNRNYKLETSQGPMVARLYGERTSELGIDRKREFDCLTIASLLGIAPPAIGFWPEKNLLITQFVPGESLTEEKAKAPKTLKKIAATLRILHQGPAFSGHFCPIQTVEDYYHKARKENVSFPKTIQNIFSYLEKIKVDSQKTPCHNDLLASNFIDDGEKIWILDWEYAGMGHPLFDVANFCVNQNLTLEECHYFLELYLDNSENDLPLSLRQNLLLMRTLSDLRESFWGFLQKGISALEVDYGQYAHFHLERFFLHKQEMEMWESNYTNFQEIL